MNSSEEGPRAESAHEPNVIRNSDSDDDADAFTEPAGVRPHAIPRQAPHVEPAGGLHRVAGADIKNIMNSKKDMYTILATHGQLHLPCYDDVSMEFLREVMAERKRLIPLRNVVHVNVPKFEEFQTERLYRQALADPNMRLFLPEPHQNDKRSVSRKFLFNVIATLHPDYFQAEINKAYKQRKEKKMLQENRFIEFGPNMLNLVQNCNHVATGGSKNRALQLLNKGGGRRNPASKENQPQAPAQAQAQPMAPPGRDGNARQAQFGGPDMFASGGLNAGSAFANVQWRD